MNEVVREEIAARLLKKGRLTFAEFMEVALYHPTAGYYNRPEMTIGEGGDFYTSPMVHPIFGACIARQVQQMWEILGCPHAFFVLEMGAGVGTLAVDFLREAEKMPPFYAAVQYHIVEQGTLLREKQQEKAQEQGYADQIHWYRTLEDVLAVRGEQVGVIFSNELFDALPVHRLGKVENGFEEYYIEAAGDEYREVAGTLSDPTLPMLAGDETLLQLQAGDRFEVCPAAEKVIAAMGQLLLSGFVLSIDYGNLAPDVHLPHHRRDGVRAYYKQVARPVLERVGEQDLTADVDFSLLIRCGAVAGLFEVGFTNQMNLLGGNGFLNKVAELQSRKFDLMADAELFKMLGLFMPQSLGEVFKVLIQAKGLPIPAHEVKKRLNALTFSLNE